MLWLSTTSVGSKADLAGTSLSLTVVNLRLIFAGDPIACWSAQKQEKRRA
jgi:hypothetical protein